MNLIRRIIEWFRRKKLSYISRGWLNHQYDQTHDDNPTSKKSMKEL